MIRFHFKELLAEKERKLNRRITRAELSRETGISQPVLSSLTSFSRQVVTNTAYVEALCRYFRCTPNDLMVLDPPIGDERTCHIDELYPSRRRSSAE